MKIFNKPYIKAIGIVILCYTLALLYMIYLQNIVDTFLIINKLK